jgi:ribosomal protein L44E
MGGSVKHYCTRCEKGVKHKCANSKESDADRIARINRTGPQ